MLFRSLTMIQDADSIIGSFVRAGKIKPLATVYPRRAPGYMDVPTLRELGANDIGIYRWFILLANSSADPKIIAHLKQVMGKPEVKKEFEELGLDTNLKSASTFLRDETRKVHRVLNEYKVER